MNGKKKKPVAADGGSGKSGKGGKKENKKDGSKDSGEWDDLNPIPCTG